MPSSAMAPLQQLKVLGTLGAAAGYASWHATIRRDATMRVFTGAGRRDRYATYERIRAQGPVALSTTGVYVVTSHAGVDALLRSRNTSVASRGGPPESYHFDISLLELDPPDHTRLRALVAPAFTARRIRAQEERLRVAIDTFTDRLAAQLAEGPVDLMAGFARPVPVMVITILLGVPDHEVGPLTRYGDAVGLALDGVHSLRQHRELREADAQLRALFARLIARRRTDPGDDLISQLVAAEQDQKLTEDELVMLATLVLLAGFETTVNLIGNGVAALLDRPDLWRRLTDNPAGAETVVLETLRQDPPVQLTGRTATADLEIDGTTVPSGRTVLGLIAAANRDPDIFPRPAAFDPDRPNLRDHLAFGSGIHHCVGRPLAELEARLALESLATRLPGLSRGGRETMGRGAVLHGRAALPVRLARQHA